MPLTPAAKSFLKSHKKTVASAIGFVVAMPFLFWAWSSSAPARGRLTARFDLSRGHYTFLTYGLEPPQRREIARLLQERYGIELRTVAGDIVSEDLVSYVDGYDGVMSRATTSKFGHDVYRECAAEAYRLEPETPPERGNPR